MPAEKARIAHTSSLHTPTRDWARKARICATARLAAGSSRADGSPVCEGLWEDYTQTGSGAMQDRDLLSRLVKKGILEMHGSKKGACYADASKDMDESK
jgi:hypothetical protein